MDPVLTVCEDSGKQDCVCGLPHSTAHMCAWMGGYVSSSCNEAIPVSCFSTFWCFLRLVCVCVCVSNSLYLALMFTNTIEYSMCDMQYGGPEPNTLTNLLGYNIPSLTTHICHTYILLVMYSSHSIKQKLSSKH